MGLHRRRLVIGCNRSGMATSTSGWCFGIAENTAYMFRTIWVIKAAIFAFQHGVISQRVFHSLRERGNSWLDLHRLTILAEQGRTDCRN